MKKKIYIFVQVLLECLNSSHTHTHFNCLIKVTFAMYNILSNPVIHNEKYF